MYFIVLKFREENEIIFFKFRFHSNKKVIKLLDKLQSNLLDVIKYPPHIFKKFII